MTTIQVAPAVELLCWNGGRNEEDLIADAKPASATALDGTGGVNLSANPDLTSEMLTRPTDEELVELRKDPQGVEASLHFYQILDLDPNTQTFYADINLRLQFSPHDAEHEYKIIDQMKQMNHGKYFMGEDRVLEFQRKLPSHPFYLLSNAKERDLKCMSVDIMEDGRIDLSIMMRGYFTEEFELRDFPYDVQPVSIQLRLLPDLHRLSPYYFHNPSNDTIGQGFYRKIAH